jgi:DMSO/TMAO reductase YedYZ heme-binding membrane subunit
VTSGRELWYLTRGSGVVALVLLTAVVVLGILTTLRLGTSRWPRFAVNGLHRNLTLVSIAFVALHVVTTVADGYAPIGLKDAVVPFASPYRPVWLGLGAVAFDLLLALALTSYLRHRIGARAWRGVHWLAYASWPVALLHSLGTGSDARAGWLAALGLGSLAVVVLAALVRVLARDGRPAPRLAGAALAVAVPLALALWYASGPAQRGWAARAGTPSHLRASVRAASFELVRPAATAAPASPPRSFTAHADGTVRTTRSADRSELHVTVVLRLHGTPGGALRVDLRGPPIGGGGVGLDASGVSFVPATTRAVYLGQVTALQGSLIGAHVEDAQGDALDLTLDLALDSENGTASGSVRAVR